MKTITKIITKLDCCLGAPLGRDNIGAIGLVPKGTRVFDCAVPMTSDGAYDKGGAYWGIGKQLRVKYTKDLSFVYFYRNEK